MGTHEFEPSELCFTSIANAELVAIPECDDNIVILQSLAREYRRDVWYVIMNDVVVFAGTRDGARYIRDRLRVVELDRGRDETKVFFDIWMSPVRV
jgi:hypothetical protein